MLKTAKKRLTYRRALQILGLLAALGIGILWFSNTPISILGIEIQDNHEPFLYMLGVMGALVVVVLTIFFPRLVSDEPIFSDEHAHVRIQKTRRENMLALMEEIWIKGFLDHALNEMKAINLDLQLVEPEKVLHRLGKELPLPTTADIHKVFTQFSRRLVILGEPGAGKTVLLLQLARELIVEAKTDEHKPIPIVFALSSWAAEQLPLETWLKGELREKYGISRRDAAELVESEEMLYLLDGLDEVAEPHRDACLQAIKKFVEEERPLVHYALCSRRTEFEYLSTRLDIPAGEILVQPLQPKRIAEYLRGDEFVAFRSLMRENSLIREGFATVPFMLNTMAVVTRGIEKNALQLAVSMEEDEAKLRDYFLENYIQRRLEEQRDKRYPDFRRTRIYLKWLAEQLVRHNQTDFYIENLQPDWLTSIRRQKLYLFRVRLLIYLLAYIGFALPFGIPAGLLMGFSTLWLVSWAKELKQINVRDQLIWEFRWWQLLAGLLLGLVTGFALEYFGITNNKAPSLALGMAFGVSLGFGTQGKIHRRLRPNVGIYRSFLNAVRVALLFMSGGSLLVNIVGGPVLLLGGSLGVGIMASLLHGGLTSVQHYVLRRQLAAAGHIPRWRYDRFLDYAAQLVILRKVGGGYRFVHDYMRQYLASAAFVPDAVNTTPSDKS